MSSGEAARRERRATRVVIYVSRAFCSTDQEKREIARSPYNKISVLKMLRSESEFGTPVVSKKQCSHHRGIEKLQVLY